MATVTPTTASIGPNATRVTWTGMVTGDTITAFAAREVTRASFQAFGTFGGGTVVGLTGSLDGTNFAVVEDSFGGAISAKTAAFIVGVGVNATDYKPTIGSGAADSITAILTVWS